MIRKIGDMWSIFKTTDNFIVTTNSYIRTDGAIVMGRGIAKQLRNKHPGIDKALAAGVDHLGYYGLSAVIGPDFQNIIAFQVKYHFAEDATLALITKSTNMLDAWSRRFSNRRYDMNFPGIGFGGLAYDDVLPIIESLPDNVRVWTFT